MSRNYRKPGKQAYYEAALALASRLPEDILWSEDVERCARPADPPPPNLTHADTRQAIWKAIRHVRGRRGQPATLRRPPALRAP